MKSKYIEVVGRDGLRGKVVDFSVMYTSLLESGNMPEEEKALIRIPNNIFFQKATKRWKGKERALKNISWKKMIKTNLRIIMAKFTHI